MKIDGVSLAAGSHQSWVRPTNDKQCAKHQCAKHTHNQAPHAETSPDVNVKSHELPGVIRLLQEGHFKGVADVRLRINFFEELQTLQQNELRATAGQALPGFIEAVGKGLETLLSSDSLSAEQASAITAAGEKFTQALEQILADSQGTANFSQETITSPIDKAFQELTAAIQSVLAPTDTAEGTPDSTAEATGETAPVDPISESDPAATETAATDTGTILEAFKSSYVSALKQLQETLAQANILPPLSEPEGNGKAYAKFLAIYQNMLGEGSQAGTPSGETLDSVA
jgi:hypothetical protein